MLFLHLSIFNSFSLLDFSSLYYSLILSLNLHYLQPFPSFFISLSSHYSLLYHYSSFIPSSFFIWTLLLPMFFSINFLFSISFNPYFFYTKKTNYSLSLYIYFFWWNFFCYFLQLYSRLMIFCVFITLFWIDTFWFFFFFKLKFSITNNLSPLLLFFFWKWGFECISKHN